MRMRNVFPIAAVLSLAAFAAPTPAAAYFVHTVSAGESLSSVAAADGLSVDQLAAANGLSADSELTAGTSLSIPPQSASGEVVGASEPVPTSESTSSPGGYLVQAGDTLSAIAAREGTTVSALAAANGLDPNGTLISGSTLSLSGSAPASSSTSTGSTGGYLVQPGDTLSAIAARQGTTVDSLAAANGLDPNGLLLSGSSLSLSGEAAVATSSSAAAGYLVQPGDTLSAIAAREGTTVSALAAANGLDPNGILPSGTTLSASGSSAVSGSSTATTGQPIGTSALSSPSGAPYPTPETVSASQVGSIAAADGVPPSLAEAVGWQESGFNNDLTSSTGAHGVMQIEPGTWDWIQNSLAGNSLSPASASDNVRGGVLMLRSLLQSTGGDEAQAAAGYYQGLRSVQEHGMYADTQNYVNSVLSLANRFGGG